MINEKLKLVAFGRTPSSQIQSFEEGLQCHIPDCLLQIDQNQRSRELWLASYMQVRREFRRISSFPFVEFLIHGDYTDKSGGISCPWRAVQDKLLSSPEQQ